MGFDVGLIWGSIWGSIWGFWQKTKGFWQKTWGSIPHSIPGFVPKVGEILNHF
jgi:hypothetical protein